MVRKEGTKKDGFVHEGVAELSLVGGIGCGDFLVRLALERLVELEYDYVVLQATPIAISFYERFGFVRVGAIATYETEPGVITGYRHWTYSDEKKLDKHGGPSYMMAMRLRDDEPPTYLPHIHKILVDDKPVVKSRVEGQEEQLEIVVPKKEFPKNKKVVNKPPPTPPARGTVSDDEVPARKKKKKIMIEQVSE